MSPYYKFQEHRLGIPNTYTHKTLSKNLLPGVKLIPLYSRSYPPNDTTTIRHFNTSPQLHIYLTIST